MATISEVFALALQHHQAGRIQAAEQIYRQILAQQPNHADALHLLGVMASQAGKHDLAVQFIRRAIAVKGNEASFHMNLGNVLKEQGKSEEAIACYRHALQRKPDYADAHNNLGVVLKEQGKLDEAIARYRRALQLKPNFAVVHNNLGVALREQGKTEEAVASCRRAIELQPEYAEAQNNLGAMLKDQGKLDDALASCRRALELRPDYAEAHNNLGNALEETGKLEEALGCYCRAVELKPDFAEAHNNLGTALWEQGKLDEALACYRRALELKPNYTRAHSNLLYALMFSSNCDAATLYEEHCRWNLVHAAPLAKTIQPHGNDRSPDRPLRVGYVSPNFRYHPVARFLLPLLESHDSSKVETYCYASVDVQDAMTDRCRQQAGVWRDVRGMSDEQVALTIRQDRIDILVDLSMHMGNNRLLVFARKPAPVQVTYLAYCGTTGMAAINYRLTDPYLDPPSQDPSTALERFYSEQSIHLPETYWCYRPAIETPPANTPPAAESGAITFGSLNNLCKVTAPTLAAWTRVLQEVPQSRLLLHARAGSHRNRLRTFLSEQDVSPDRLEFVDFQPLAEYYDTYRRIDIALDPFPYGGGTTTCDALWMGVPVVSLAGQTAVGRGGRSILSNIGLPELVASDHAQYVQIAVELASDLPRLANLRMTLRDRMQSSALMDATRFARNVEAAYREMWRNWCVKAHAP